MLKYNVVIKSYKLWCLWTTYWLKVLYWLFWYVLAWVWTCFGYRNTCNDELDWCLDKWLILEAFCCAHGLPNGRVPHMAMCHYSFRCKVHMIRDTIVCSTGLTHGRRHDHVYQVRELHGLEHGLGYRSVGKPHKRVGEPHTHVTHVGENCKVFPKMSWFFLVWSLIVCKLCLGPRGSNLSLVNECSSSFYIIYEIMKFIW